ncbi:hypothetical protein Pmani_000998 [Petrolisthes manimaculis]|uniref:Uncharacterized protein n=1 Tax=Petrolisthes manimaculis TaxID=1843537 RepID=A0AAE1URZ0_9EUCA|nr:hypothetical protein Pmani_000998 [Petrolisthes manimaculis]
MAHNPTITEKKRFHQLSLRKVAKSPMKLVPQATVSLRNVQSYSKRHLHNTSETNAKLSTIHKKYIYMTPPQHRTNSRSSP